MQTSQAATSGMASRLIPKNVFSRIPSRTPSDLELLELKLPSALRIQPNAFNAATYQIEDPITFKNDVRSNGNYLL